MLPAPRDGASTGRAGRQPFHGRVDLNIWRLSNVGDFMQTTIPVYNLISSVVKVLREVYHRGNSSPPQAVGFSCQEIHKP